MQGLADGYFVIPYTIGNYLAREKFEKVPESHPEIAAAEAAVAARTRRLLDVKGGRTVTSFHRELGKIMWDHCGMARDKKGLEHALGKIPALREEFWKNVTVPGSGQELNQSLEAAGRVADFLELGELMCLDALERGRVLRQPLPPRAPDGRRRGEARTTRTSATSPRGSTRATGSSPTATWSR